jgi:hypothetical protein
MIPALGEGERRYWPFPVLQPENPSEAYQEQLRFLNLELERCYRPYIYKMVHVVMSVTNQDGRYAEIMLRSSRIYEVEVFGRTEACHRFLLNNFSAAEKAAFLWLEGGTVAEVIGNARVTWPL